MWERNALVDVKIFEQIWHSCATRSGSGCLTKRNTGMVLISKAVDANPQTVIVRGDEAGTKLLGLVIT